MIVLTSLIFALSIFIPVNCEDNNNNIEMILGYHYLYNNRFVLNITQFNNKISKNDNTFNENSIYCLKSNSDNMNNSIKIKSNHKQIDKPNGQFVVYYMYELLPEMEGFIQCYIKRNTTLPDTKSNIKFFRFEDNVFVLKLKLPEEMNKNEVAKNIERLVNAQLFKASIKVNNTVHLTSSISKVSPDNDIIILNNLTQIVKENFNNSEFIINDIRSTRYCPPFKSDQFNLPQTIPGTLFPTKIKNENDYPYTVQCLGDFYTGYHWNQTDIDVIINATTKILPTASAIVSSGSFDSNTQFETPYDIQDFADKLSTLKNLSASEIPKLTSKMDLLLSKNIKVFSGLREKLNTSNEILSSLDVILINTEGIQDNGFIESVRPNFAARVEDVRITLGAGVAVLDDTEYTPLSEETFIPITQNMSTESIMNLAPRAAILLPSSLLNAHDTPDRLALSVFTTGAIFSSKPTSAVVSANLGGRHFTNLRDPVRIWFRRNVSRNPDPGVCVAWDFSKNLGRGDWSIQGCRLITTHTNISYENYNNVLDECACWHLTHFGELFWHSDEPMMESLHPSHSKTLDLITLTGCCLSLAGLTGVFITAIVAPEWLRGPGQKIQLQISINLACLIILFLLLSYLDLKLHFCIFLGILLHYSMLSNFCWMLLAAYLQYSRLVKVVSSRSSRLPLKSGLIGWILPMVPCICILVTGQYEVYSKPPMCLPRGLAFYTSILTPLVVVMCCNTVVFILIARNLYVNIKIRRHDKTCLSFRRFKQLVFLFVLLGLSWLFSIAQLVTPKPWNIIFSYFFCICIAGKGLTYFIFFILMDESAKNAWKLRFCPSHARYDVKRYTMNSYRSSKMTSSISGGSNGTNEVITKPIV